MHTATKDYRMAPASHSAAQDPRRNRQAWSVLIVSTLAFTVCFMVWMMFGIIGIPIKKMLDLNATQFGLLTAMPVLTGSLVRVPLGCRTCALLSARPPAARKRHPPAPSPMRRQ